MRYPHRTLVASTALILAALAPAAAAAQTQPGPTQPGPTQPGPTQPASPIDEARTRFEAGVAAMQRREWPAAFESLEASMRLRRSAAVALNLGVTLRELHRYMEARLRLNEFMELATPPQHQQHDAEVAQMQLDTVRRLSTLRVPQLVPASAVLTIDGRRVQLNDAGETTLDPGPHTVRAEAVTYEPFEERVEFAESQMRELRITLVAAAPLAALNTSGGPHPANAQPGDPRVAPTQPAQAASHPFYTRWWFWTAVGVVVAGGVTAGVVVASSRVRPYPTTNTNTTLQAATSEGGL